MDIMHNGADVGTTDAIGWTPLSWAAVGGREAVVRSLLESGPNPESRDKNGYNTSVVGGE
jgi:ankyrin repeat protein